MKGIQVDFFIKTPDGDEKNVLSTWLQQIPQVGSTVHLRQQVDLDTKFKWTYRVLDIHHVITNNLDNSNKELVITERVEIFIESLSE